MQSNQPNQDGNRAVELRSGDDRVRPLVKGREFQETCLFHAESNFPPIFFGEPGTGKTEKAKAMAHNPELKAIMGVDKITGFIIPGQQATDESINGYPLSEKTDGQPKIIYALPKYCAEGPILLIVDEIGKAKQHVQDCLYPWLTGDEQINGYRLHPKSLVILLDNDITHRAGSRELDNAIKGRYADYDFEPELGEWVDDYAMPRVKEGKMGIEVVQYLRAHPDRLNIFNPNSKLHGQPCPRKWAAVGRGLMTRSRLETKYKGFCAEVGMVEGRKFIDFLKNLTLLPTREDVMQRAGTFPMPVSLEEAYRLAGFVAGILKTPKSSCGSEGELLAAGAATLTGRIAEAGFAEMAAWVLREAMKRARALNGDCLLLTPFVGRVLNGFPELTTFISNLGSVEANQ